MLHCCFGLQPRPCKWPADVTRTAVVVFAFVITVIGTMVVTSIVTNVELLAVDVVGSRLPLRPSSLSPSTSSVVMNVVLAIVGVLVVAVVDVVVNADLAFISPQSAPVR